MAKPRTCFYLDQTMTDSAGNHVPAIVTEGESGFYRSDYNYGPDFDRAKAAVASANADLGLSMQDVLDIVFSSMRASNVL